MGGDKYYAQSKLSRDSWRRFREFSCWHRKTVTERSRLPNSRSRGFSGRLYKPNFIGWLAGGGQNGVLGTCRYSPPVPLINTCGLINDVNSEYFAHCVRYLFPINCHNLSKNNITQLNPKEAERFNAKLISRELSIFIYIQQCHIMVAQSYPYLEHGAKEPPVLIFIIY